MEILEFNVINMKIMKILKIELENHENHENLIIPYENHELTKKQCYNSF